MLRDLDEMNFVVTKSVAKARLGRLQFERLTVPSKRKLAQDDGQEAETAADQELAATYRTPMCLQYTRNGVIPDVSWEMATSINDENLPVLLALPTTIGIKEQLEHSKQSLSEFAMIDKRRPTVCIVQDPTEPIRTGQNTKNGICVWAQGGKQVLNASTFLDLQRILHCTAFQSLCDGDTPVDAAKKRLSHSVTRTLEYLDEVLEEGKSCKNARVFATIEGGYDVNHRLLSAQESAKRDVSGFIIDGFHTNGAASSLAIDMNQVKPILSAVLEKLPANKPRAVFGVFNLSTIRELVEQGVDMFDTSYAYHLTQQNTALCLVGDTLAHKLLVMSDKWARDSHDIIAEGCLCYVCTRKFTSAYVHHLIETKEMLANTLLMIHNVHSFVRYFERLRVHLAKKENGIRVSGDE